MRALKNAFYVLLDNLDYYAVLILLFIAVFAIIFMLVSALAGPRDETGARLSKLLGKEKPKKKTAEEKPHFLNQEETGLAGKISRPLHRVSALDDRKEKNKLHLRLVRAGYRSEKAVYNFLAAKIILPIAFIAFYLVTRIYYNFASEMILAIVLLVLLGFFTPTAWVWLMTKARQERLFKGLPDALDLMVVCVESGLGLDMTFKRVGDEMQSLCKELADEFTLTNLEIRAGCPRDDAFRNMYNRTGVPEINNLMTVLIQTSRFGTSLATALRVHADSMRVKRRQIAEETAAKATVKLIFPLVLCIFPAIFIVLIGPGAIKIVKHLFPVLSGGG
jgi:tight adherence protein C